MLKTLQPPGNKSSVALPCSAVASRGLSLLIVTGLFGFWMEASAQLPGNDTSKIESARQATGPAGVSTEGQAESPIADTNSSEVVASGASDEAESASFSRTEALLAALTIFALAIFVGVELISKVPPTLHTPLMSGSNAISGITVVGAILMAGSSGWTAFFGMLAVALATINVVGGFLVTDRMLGMFRR